MRRCPRCGKWHHGRDSETCDACWEDIGQMQFWQDSDEAVAADQYDDDHEPPIDTVFDREEEARGWQ